MFYGKPETNKQTILMLAQYIIKGNYIKGKNLLLDNLTLDVFTNDTKKFYLENLKMVSLRNYVIYYQSELNNIDINTMKDIIEENINSNKNSKLFDLKLKNEINKLIIYKIIKAKWNNETLEFYSNNNYDVLFSKQIRGLQNKIEHIANNNILLLENAYRVN